MKELPLQHQLLFTNLKLAREAEMAARMAELMVEKEIAAFEAKLVADA